MKRFRFLLLPFMCAVCWSCEGELLDTDAVSRTVQVNATIEGLRTRASDNAWASGDAIGLYMKKSGQALNAASIYENVKYITSGTAVFQPEVETDKLLFPFNGSDVDFIAYYPFTSEIASFIYPVDVSNQSDQAAIDLLYSNNAAGLNAKSPFANMTFSHQLTKIVLNVRPENASQDLSGLSVKLTGTGNKANFSLTSGTLSAPTSTGDIVFKTAANGLFAEAIVLPSADLSGKQLVFTIGEEVYVFLLSAATNIHSFEKSTRYTYNVTLNPRGVTAVTEGGIYDWTNGPSEDIALDPTTGEVPDVTKGTKENPFTVEEAKLNEGKTGVWVEGYIVGFYSSTTFNSFVNDTINASASNLALATSMDEVVAANTFSIGLPSGSIRNALNLQQHPENFKKKVLIKGNIESYFSITGIRKPSEYEIIATEP